MNKIFVYYKMEEDLYGVFGGVSLSELVYDEDSIAYMKRKLLRWMSRLTTNRRFLEDTIDQTVYENEDELKDIISDIIRCASELVDAVIESLGGVVNREYFQAIGCCCLILSMKFMGAVDWVYDDIDYYKVISFYTDGAEGTTRSHLIRMEADILERTDWKGCPSSFIHQ